MTDPTPTPTTAPTIPMSEPEKERRLMDAALDAMTSTEARRIISLTNILDTLHGADLTVDDDGFIIRQETGEYATPYMYSRDAFKEIESPVDDPLATYARPETEVTECILSQGIIHLADLHTVTYIDGTAYPVRDDKMALVQMHGEIGFMYTTVTQWSDSKDLIDNDAFPGPNVIVSHDGLADEIVTLTCHGCAFTGTPDQWAGDEDDPECPDCGGDWRTRGLEHCTECNTTHYWEDIDHGTTQYCTPSCPDCNADHMKLESFTRYDRANGVEPSWNTTITD